MDAVGSSGRLLGISEGGTMCVNFAATHPGADDRARAWGSFAKVCVRRIIRSFDPAEVEGTMRWIEEAGHRTSRGARSCSRPPGRRRDARMMGHMGARRHPTTAVASLRFAITCDVRDVLPAISAPTLVIHLTISSSVGTVNLARRIPGARF
jgi:pimeloyl-ACP methyl ester carboxylesterase